MIKRVVCTNIVRKLYLVYFLNVLDWVCTILLLKTGMFFEANPIANTFIDNILVGFALKCALPFVVVFLVNHFMVILDIPELRIADKMISFTLTVYLAVTLDHIINFVIYIVR